MIMSSQHGKKRPHNVSGDISAVDFEPESMLSRAPIAAHRGAAIAAPADVGDQGAQRKALLGGTGDNSKRRKRLEKALKQIAELKLRRARGQTLDRSMEDKIGRESSIVAELAQGSTPAPPLSSEDFICVHEALAREEELAARAGAVHQSMSFVVDAGRASAKTAKTADERGRAVGAGAKQRKLDRQRELAWLRDEADED